MKGRGDFFDRENIITSIKVQRASKYPEPVVLFIMIRDRLRCNDTEPPRSPPF